MNARAQQRTAAEQGSHSKSDVVPAGASGREAGREPLFPGGDPKSRDGAYLSLSEPRFVEGDAERGKRVVERWERAIAAGQPAPMSELASAMLWSGDMGNGWVLDDETGEVVARLDPGWLLERGRAWSQAVTNRDQEKPEHAEKRRAVTESGFIATSEPRARSRAR